MDDIKKNISFIRLRLNTPQPACWSAAEIPFTGLRGASFSIWIVESGDN